MKNFLFCLLMVLGGMSLQAQTYKDAAAEARPVSSFHAIKISNSFDLYLTQGGEEGLAVSAAREEFKARIKTSVENGVLIIGYDNDGRWKNENNKKLKAYVSFKMLDRLQVSGACDIFVNGSIKADDLVLDVSGASDFKKTEIYANNLTVNLNGASDIFLTGGKVTTLNVLARGASDFHGYDLQTDNCTAEAHGASDIRITVNKELKAVASGASGILYKGTAVIREVKSSGASSVSKRG